MAIQTATELRERSTACLAEKEASFDRCDTDGFMSQAANGIMSRVYATQADIKENGGRAVFIGLYEGDRRVPAKIIETRFGWTWILADQADEAKFGRKFIPLLLGKTSRIQKQLGLSERQEWDAAWAKCGGWYSVRTYRTGDQYGRDAELIEEDE